MSHFGKYGAFSVDKQRFFSESHTNVDAIRTASLTHSYDFIADNRILIEQEVSQLFAALEKQENKNQEFLQYCYYCCTMLHAYYATYDKKVKEAEYLDKANQLRQQLESASVAAPAKAIHTLSQQIKADLVDLASTPMHTSKIKSKLGLSNVYRIHILFCRLTIGKALLLANELKWFDKLDQMLGTHTDVQRMLDTLKAPTDVFNFLSVGLFVGRFLINVGTTLKHTLTKNPGETHLSWKTVKARLSREIVDLHWVLVNDAVWASTNLITNYNTYFNISGPVALWLTSGLLCFDVAWLLYRHRFDEKEYQVKKEQYTEEKEDLKSQMTVFKTQLKKETLENETVKALLKLQQDLLSCEVSQNQHLQALHLSIKNGYEDQLQACGQRLSAAMPDDEALKKLLRAQDHYAMLKHQINALDMAWQKNSATIRFNTAAAFLLASGFSAAYLLSAVLAPIVGYFICIFAVAMYINADQYGAYKEKALIVADRESHHLDTSDAQKEMQAAWHNLCVAMTKSIVMPMAMVTAFAISWPAALILTAAYLGYQATSGYRKPQPTTPAVVAQLPHSVNDAHIEEEQRTCPCF